MMPRPSTRGETGRRPGDTRSTRTVGRYVPLLLVALLVEGCYSFRGGSAPAHLETILIPQVADDSGFGRGTIRFDLTDRLIDRFRRDNSLRVIDDQEADSRLDVTITTIRTDIRRAVSDDDRETVRGVVVEAKATFYDNVKGRAIYENTRTQGESSYDIGEGADGEKEAIAEAIEKLSNEILLETVADW